MPSIFSRHARAVLDGAPDPFAEPGVGPNYAPSRSVRIEHVTVRLSLNPVERTFSGSAELLFTPLPIFDGTACFDLEEVDVSSVTDADGVPLDYTLGDGVLAVKSGNATTIVVQWTGSEPSRGLYFTGPTDREPDRQHMAWTQCQDEDGHFVFPCHDHPRVKHPWTIELDAPAGYTLLSNGKQTEGGDRSGRVWSRWEQREPMPAYLFTAVAARLTRIDATDTATPVAYYVPVGQEDGTIRSMGKTPLMIEAFARKTGVPYPWPRYDQVVVHDFIFGGMENVACTTMTDLLLVDEKAVLEWDPDGLVSHELAHQWFGDLVTCQDWSQAWLNESWATFMEQVWWAEDRGETETTWYRWETAQGYHGEDSGRYRRPIVSYTFREPIDVFDRHLYNKGSIVLSTLRYELGEDAFWTGVKHYLETHAHSTTHTRHFQRAMEDATGANLDRFFDQWIWGAGHPALEVSLGEDKGLVTVGVKQTQSGDQTAKVFHFTLRCELVFADGSTRVVDLPVRERDRSWAIPVDGEVTTVRVDPGYRVLAAIQISGPTPWLEALAMDACPVLALRANKALISKGTSRAVAIATRALSEHPFHGVRASIASGLGKRGGTESRDALLAALDSDTDPRSTRAIVEALGTFRDAAVASALIAELSEEQDTWHLRGALLKSLGATRDPRAVDVIRQHIDEPSWGEVIAQRGVAGLAASEDPAVLDDIRVRTTAAYPERVQAAAAVALASLGDKVESVRKQARERLCEMVHEPGFRARLSAVSALGRLKDPGATATLNKVHRSDPDGRIRRSAFEALRTIRKGRTSDAGLASLRSRIDELAEQNDTLRKRLDKLDRIQE